MDFESIKGITLGLGDEVELTYVNIWDNAYRYDVTNYTIENTTQ